MTYAFPQIDRRRALAIALAAGRVSWRVAKSAACVLGNVVGAGAGVVVMAVSYGAIAAPDSMWAVIAADYQEALDAFLIRSFALAGCVFGFSIMNDCRKALQSWWFRLTVRAPKES
jgi:hypothetical protein